MSRPELETKANTYLVTWEQEGVRMLVDRIREDSRSGAVSAEVTVRLFANGHPGNHIHHGRYNLLSGRGKSDLAKQCGKWATFERPLQWDEMVEQAAVMVVLKHREGEPVQVLDQDAQFDKLEYRVYPLIQEGLPNLLFGDGGSGKTMLAQYLGMLVHGRLLTDSMGFDAEPGNVLYLDYETTREMNERRLRMLEEGFGAPDKTQMLYRRCYQPLSYDIEEVQRIVADYDIELVIVDSVGQAGGSEIEGSHDPVEYYRALRLLNITSLSISHVTKGEEQKKAYGNVYWMNYARNAWELRINNEDREEGKLTLGLFHRKVNEGAYQKPMGIEMQFRSNSVALGKTDIYADPVISKSGSLRERIQWELKRGRMTVDELAGELGAKHGDLRTTLNRYTKLFTKEPGKRGLEKWGLLSYEAS